MDFIRALFCLLVTIGVSLTTIHGSHSMVSRSRSQENRHKRHIVKSIKTKNGDIYDCIDFYEQPAFKHPRLKNHKFYPEMRPNLMPIDTKSRDDVETSEASRPLALEDGGCPHGFVPIKRRSKAHHARIAMFSKTLANRSNSPNDESDSGTHLAIVQSTKTQNYYGVGAVLSVWNPQVGEYQYSMGRVSIQNGPDIIQAGWMVNPTMHQDNRTHMFIHTDAGDSHCFDTYCPGFVLVQSDIPTDLAFDSYSVKGQYPIMTYIFIYREAMSGSWWLLVGKDYTPIGFWPERIFNSLTNFGNYVSCGGEIYSPPDTSYPPMGSGQCPDGFVEQSAFGLYFESANENLQKIDVQDTEPVQEDDNKYGVQDLGIKKVGGHVLFYGGGGPGTQPCPANP